MNIADRIQQLRKIKGISQEELADTIGVSRQAVSKWESEQSIPDMDKIITMSDYFEVTTDYLLKGIETEKQTAETTVNAMVFMFVGTALSLIGLLVSCALWYEQQIPMAVVYGLVFMVVGCMVFGIGWTYSTQNKKEAKRYFWTTNIWLLTFIPLSAIANVLFAHNVAPYPLLAGQPLILVSFWLVYIAVCLCVVFVQVKGRRQ